MFGYIKIDKNELKIKDYNLFKSYYCGVCRTLKADYGFPSHYFLSYDAAFLSVLLEAVSDREPLFHPVRCMANPAVQRPVADKNDVTAYAAAVNVLLVWFKLKDDWADNRSFRSLFMMPLMLRKKNKAKKRFPILYERIKAHLASLSVLEKENCAEPDSVAAAFGALMAGIFDTDLIKNEDTRRVLSHTGFLLGRLIYLMDARADREEDKKKHAYNPLLLSKEINDETLRLSFDYTLGELANTLSLLEFRRNREIIENIVYLGLRQAAQSVFADENIRKDKKKENRHERPI